MIHFGWFAGYAHGPRGWEAPNATKGVDWREPEIYQEMARICERGMFDFALFADALGVPAGYGGSIANHVRYGLEGVYHDTTVLAPLVAAATNHIGVGTTVSTTFMPPYILARQIATLDHLTRGRIAWNVVTSLSNDEAQNFGFREILAHDDRYDRADEYMDLCFQLWDSWKPGSVLMDRESGEFADPTKVAPVSFEGKYFSCKGPLNVTRSPQGRPAIIQAGASERGRQFASRWADAVIVNLHSVGEMKAFYDDIKSRAVNHGRKEDDLRVFFNIKPTLGETHSIAEIRRTFRERPERIAVDAGLGVLSMKFGIDLSQYDLDQPLPTFETGELRAAQSIYAQYAASTATLRELAIQADYGERLPVLGDPEEVASTLESVMDEVGGDGFTIRVDSYSHHYMLEFVNSVVPILQQRGRVRQEYSGDTLREHLAENDCPDPQDVNSGVAT